MKIACFSVAAMDYFPKLNCYYAGGNSLNQSIRFSHLGHKTAFIGALGKDENGNRIAELLQSESVDCSHMYRLEGNTASNKLVNDETGERFEIEGAWQNGVYGEFRLNKKDWKFLQDFDVWTTHANCPDYTIALEKKKKTQFMSVDFLHLKDYDLLDHSLSYINIAFFGGTADMQDDLFRISGKKNGLIVLTLGAEGSMAFYRSKIYIQKALQAEKLIDTTGCGDAFQAGFTSSFLKNKDITKALLFGAELGRTALGQYGGVPWK